MPLPRPRPLADRPFAERVRAAALGTLAATLVLGGVAALFQRAAAPPWLPPEQARLIAHCDAERVPAARRACIADTLAAERAVAFARLRSVPMPRSAQTVPAEHAVN